MTFIRHLVHACAAGTFLFYSGAYGSDAVPADGASHDFVDEVLVVGARLPRRADDVVGKVDVITHQMLVDDLATNLSDVVRYTPGVSTSSADSRFGATEITIRGLSGNRVASLIDGIPVPDQFDIGAFANAGQDYLVPDVLSRVEILRGPASTLFGSDALGGVFAVVTREPGEFLTAGNPSFGASATYSGRDDSTTINGSFALGGPVAGGHASGVLHLMHSDGSEIRSAAASVRDSQDWTRTSLYTRLAYELPSGNRLRLNASSFEEDVLTDMVSVLGYGRQFRSTTSLTGDDHRQRQAMSIGYDFTTRGAWLDHGQLDAYFQSVSVDQRTSDERQLLEVLNRRNFQYETEHYGVILDLDSSFTTGRADHRLGWGASAERGVIRERRDGYSVNLASGATTRTLLGEEMPVRDFPRSRVDELAVYVHDEISFGRWTLIPALRFQTYRLNASADEIFIQDNPDTRVVDARESSLAPKLGVLVHLGPGTQLYGQYAHGFRAPPFEDLNIGLDIPLFNIRAIPNPDLRPETSDGIELGLRHHARSFRVAVAGFAVDYDDLIETKASLGADPETGTLLFQSRNIDAARVYGVELNFSASLERWVSGLTLDAAAAVTRGRNRTTDRPLNTVDPAELVTRLNWSPGDRWRVGVVLKAVAAKDHVDDPTQALATTGSYVVLDLTGGFRISDRVQLDAGLFNVFDETYWEWGAVRNRVEGDPMIDQLSAPGRYASVSVRATL